MSPISLSPTLLNPYTYRRRKTREVHVGSVGVGGENPIRIQSMTITPTLDTKATVDQVLSLVQAGCEIVRITAPTIREAQNLEKIKNDLLKKGCTVPLVADIHFRPDAALVAADFVEKVRINPGNFADAKTFRIREYSDQQYHDELNRIEERFLPLLLKVKKLKRALRIGTNHGSLSDRIMNRYGDTPLGMVESALEFLHICQKHNFHDVIFSMKASNPRVMISAYRLLAHRLEEEGGDYPFHLGVTEAGDGEDGRIKSAVGIGSLLEDGIGDTIRVSLTEDPEYEIPVAKALAERYDKRKDQEEVSETLSYLEDAFSYSKRVTPNLRSGPISIGGSNPIRIHARWNLKDNPPSKLLQILEERVKIDTLPEILEIPYTGPSFIEEFDQFRNEIIKETNRLSFWVSINEPLSKKTLPQADGFVLEVTDQTNSNDVRPLLNKCSREKSLLIIKSSSVPVLIGLVKALSPAFPQLLVGLDGGQTKYPVQTIRRLVAELREIKSNVPLVLFQSKKNLDLGEAAVQGSLICDGIGDVLSIGEDTLNNEGIQFGYNLLQACGTRITKTEFVSCPSCGRTLFDLQSTTERIKSKTGHLKGVKIAIMGCIVNGPGEMADADFGYVGGGPGKINLYVGKTCVEKSIPSDVADQKLIDLIKKHGKWAEKP